MLQPCLQELMLTFAGSFFIATNAGTAANYVGFVKWACVNIKLSCAWWTDLVTLTLRGLKAEHLRLCGGPIPAKVLFTDDWVAQVACLADSKRSHTCSGGFSYVFGISHACSK